MDDFTLAILGLATCALLFGIAVAYLDEPITVVLGSPAGNWVSRGATLLLGVVATLAWGNPFLLSILGLGFVALIGGIAVARYG